MDRRRESDGRIVSGNPSNKTRDNKRVAEREERRRSAKGNPSKRNGVWTQGQWTPPKELERIRQAAERNKEEQFTALWHHVYDIGRLRRAFFSLKRKAKPGVDGQTWQEYAEDLEDNIRDLSDRLKRGAYRARPVKRVYIPKSSGEQRPIGIPSIEDKIVQKAAVEVLGAVYEVDFMGFSYGFRPERSQHNALDAVVEAIEGRKVNWVLDVDIRGFFDAIGHEWLVKFIEHRIKDKRVVRHIRKWLKAGILEKEQWGETKEGTPQGGSASPLLANIYLHYVFDVWAQSWRKKQARGDVIMVRYADDIILGFQHRQEAEKFLVEMRRRFRKFNLRLHGRKTRIVEFGRYAAQRRRERGAGKPGTFNFLGFTHICSRSRPGKFMVLRITDANKVRRKLKEVKTELRRRMHLRIAEVGKWLGSVLIGHYRYYGVPWNGKALSRFRWVVMRLWCRTLRRRSQKHRITWERMYEIAARWLPNPSICHPYPLKRLCVNTQGRSPVR